MDNFDEKVVEQLIEMFATPGWQVFMEDAAKNLSSVNTLVGINGEQDLGYRQGQIQILSGLLAYEDTLRQVQESRNADVEAAA